MQRTNVSTNTKIIWVSVEHYLIKRSRSVHCSLLPSTHTHSSSTFLSSFQCADIELSLPAGVTAASLSWVGVCGDSSAGQCGGVAPAGLQHALHATLIWELPSVCVM